MIHHILKSGISGRTPLFAGCRSSPRHPISASFAFVDAATDRLIGRYKMAQRFLTEVFLCSSFFSPFFHSQLRNPLYVFVGRFGSAPRVFHLAYFLIVVHPLLMRLVSMQFGKHEAGKEIRCMNWTRLGNGKDRTHPQDTPGYASFS